MERCTAIEEARDALSTEVARLQQQLQSQAGAAAGPSTAAPPASPGGARLKREEDVLELRLQRDQLQLQVQRLKERLAEAGGTGQDATGTARRTAGAGGRPGATGSVVPAREAELMSTVINLKAALEKATANTTPTTKYMAEVSKRKEAQRDAETARSELERLKQQLTASSRMVAELQAANSELRRQLRAAPTTAASTSGAAHGIGMAELGLQLSNLEMMLGQRDEEVAALRGALAQRDAELASNQGPGESGACGGVRGQDLKHLVS